jgi:hypothetical protein
MIFFKRINYEIINLPRGRSFAKEFHQATFPHQPEASEQLLSIRIFYIKIISKTVIDVLVHMIQLSNTEHLL